MPPAFAALRPARLAVLACLLLSAVGARAQIGPGRWSAQSLRFKVQWPFNVAQGSRYTSADGVYHLMVFDNDMPYAHGTKTLPRTEQRFNPDYTSGEIQYQAMLKAPGNENSYCIFQIHTGDAEEKAYGSTAVILSWFSSDGGSLRAENHEKLIGNLADQWFQLNVDHNLHTHTIMVWINQVLVLTRKDNGADDYYLKDGVYTQHYSPTHQMDTFVKDIHIWTKS